MQLPGEYLGTGTCHWGSLSRPLRLLRAPTIKDNQAAVAAPSAALAVQLLGINCHVVTISSCCRHKFRAELWHVQIRACCSQAVYAFGRLVAAGVASSTSLAASAGLADILRCNMQIINSIIRCTHEIAPNNVKCCNNSVGRERQRQGERTRASVREGGVAVSRRGQGQ